MLSAKFLVCLLIIQTQTIAMCKWSKFLLVWLLITVGTSCMNDDPKPTDVLQQYDRERKADTLSTVPIVTPRDSIILDTTSR